jgi:hypothetical protein
MIEAMPVRRFSPRQAALTALLAAALIASGCHKNQPLGPPVPTGATILGGPAMTSTPPQPPGFAVHVIVPSSQQQAQDTVLGYLKKTLNALPPGVVFDASRYGSAASTSPCGDQPKPPTKEFSATGDVKLPPGIDSAQLIAQVGDVWKSWGWWVFERDGMYKPNRSGFSPDGYELHIEVPGLPGAPNLTGTSPCFPRDIANNDLPFPTTITAVPGQ